MSTDRPASVSILLLGSGWTSSFLIPPLEERQISFAQTRRSQTEDQRTIAFTVNEDTLDASACQHLPQARLVIVIFPLKKGLAKRLIHAYEQGTSCRPAWLALGSTSAWSNGVATSDTPITDSNERAMAEAELLDLATEQRRVAVLNLAGLYGGQRNPSNFAKRACDTLDKVKVKTSLHLIHGVDVARAIMAMWEALNDPERVHVTWNRRWLLTGESYPGIMCTGPDTHFYLTCRWPRVRLVAATFDLTAQTDCRGRGMGKESDERTRRCFPTESVAEG